jgi:hypothetical protein
MVVMVAVAVAEVQAQLAPMQDLLVPRLQEERGASALIVLFPEQLLIMLVEVVEVDMVDLMPVMAVPEAVVEEDLVVELKEQAVLMEVVMEHR